MPRRLGDLLRAMRQRQGWTYPDVARHDSTGSLVGILQAVETGGAAHVTLDGLTAVCEALGTSLGRALLAVEATAGATEDAGRRPWADQPTDRIDLGDTMPTRTRPLGAHLATLRTRRGLTIEYTAGALNWTAQRWRDVEAGRVGVSLCELLGILNLFEITGGATTPWIRLLSLPCAHHDTTPVVTCTSCGAHWPPADGRGFNCS